MLNKLSKLLELKHESIQIVLFCLPMCKRTQINTCVVAWHAEIWYYEEQIDM